MKRYSGKKYKKCHILIYKGESGREVISMTKQVIANTLGISVKTINRHLNNKGVYECEEWYIRCNVDIIPCDRVFTGKKYEY